MKAWQHADAAFRIVARRKPIVVFLGFDLQGRVTTPTRRAIVRELSAAKDQILRGGELER